MAKVDAKKIDELLTRAVGEFIDPEGTFRKKLETNPEKIVIKFGIDPTRPDIHLGHAVVLRKLRQFQDMGCKIIFLVGDFTALIGDPTGKSKIRPEIGHAEIQNNMKTYLDQVNKILLTDKEVFAWMVNSDWFVSINDVLAPDNRSITITAGKESIKLPPLLGTNIINKALHWEETRMQKGSISNYTLITLMSILRRITFGRLIERDMFQDRIKAGEPVFMHEMMYPVIQGIDSDAISNVYGSCDLEVGGTDQHFNMLVGRDVMTMNKKVPQAVLSFKLLEGLDGKEKMSKSLDNYITITDEPADMYGKVMSVPDSSIGNYFELCTFTPLDEVKTIREGLQNGKVHPKEAKMNLARQIVAIYHGEKEATKAEQYFIDTFQKKEIPDEIMGLPKENGAETLMDILVKGEVVSSKTDFRRLVDEGAITNLDTEEKVTDAGFSPEKGSRFRIGKKRFVKIV